MRALRQERERLRAALPGSVEGLSTNTALSEDPEDLLERADALRDTKDKIERRMASMKVRLAELKEERALERRLSEFVGDESLFDEEDRRLRLRVDSTATVSVDPQTPLAGAEAQNAEAGVPGGAATAADTFAPGRASAPPSAESGAPRTESVSTTVRATDSRPQVGSGRGNLILDPELEDVGAIERELQRMSGASKELDARAKLLEEKAKNLD